MNLLWKKDIPGAQKILIGTFMLWMLGALVPIFFRSFVPTQQWQKMAWGISLLLTAVSAIWLRALYRKNLWRPSGPWLTYGPFKRLIMAPLCMAFFVVVVWLNVAVTLPLGYTSLVHAKVTRSATVEKKRGSGRSCKHQIEIPDMRYLFFEFCVNADNFDTLPKGPVPAELSIRRSYFGDHIHALRLNAAAQSAAP